MILNDKTEPQVGQLLEIALEAMGNNNISLALQQLLQAADLEPENVEIIDLVARCYFVLGEFERALACWNLALVTDPANQAVEQAIAEFNDLPFQFWLKRYREATAELENRNYAKAGEILGVLVGEQDGFVSLYQLLGLCHFAESDIEGARRVWSRGLALDVSNQVLLKYLAMQRDDQQPGPETVITRPKTRGWKTAGWALIACLGLVLVVQIGLGLYRHAEGVNGAGHTTVQKLTDSSRPIARSESLSDRPRNDFKEDSSQGDQYETEREMEYYQAGYSAYLRRDWPTACRNLSVVVSMNSGSYINREALYYLAQSYYFRKNYEQARNYFEKYLAAYPDSDYGDDSLYYLGCTALGQKDIDTAKKAFSRLKKIYPESGYLTTHEYKSLMVSK